jgi:predicted regulator of Ras-like GTPase activity (Roadblock/LC7/MglB family)
MEDILKDINAVMGVTGSFVCNGEGQVLASALPELFDKTILSTVGRTMAQTMAGLAIARRRKIGDDELSQKVAAGQHCFMFEKSPRDSSANLTF